MYELPPPAAATLIGISPLGYDLGVPCPESVTGSPSTVATYELGPPCPLPCVDYIAYDHMRCHLGGLNQHPLTWTARFGEVKPKSPFGSNVRIQGFPSQDIILSLESCSFRNSGIALGVRMFGKLPCRCLRIRVSENCGSTCGRS